jgi:hypothetical protein
MKMKFSLLAWMAGVALLISGCAGSSGPNHLGQLVLVVCKTTPAQQAAARNLSNQYFSDVASGKKARPSRRYVALQTLDPNAKQRGKYLKTREDAQKKAESKGEPLGSGRVRCYVRGVCGALNCDSFNEQGRSDPSGAALKVLATCRQDGNLG